jgi:Leucine-rich repeat (LRR) protein
MSVKLFAILGCAFIVSCILGLPTSSPAIAVAPASPAFDCVNVTEIPSAECQALVALYNGASGVSWGNSTGWLSTLTPCSWHGVACLGAHVSQLNLFSNLLSGSIPPELGNLVNLQVLDLDTNQLSGNIPPQLGNLANLQFFDLDTNQLSGNIPPQLGNLANLQFFDLDTNLLSGNVLPQLGNLANLDVFDLDTNLLSGSVPPELGNLIHLQALYLGHNLLSGPLPSSLTSVHLGVFFYDGTSLCAPADPAFQAWLAGIPNKTTPSVLCLNLRVYLPLLKR